MDGEFDDKDYLVRIISQKGSIRGLACRTTHLVHEACRRHGTYPTPCAALGRALTGGALMGALLKTRQRVALKFEGNGPIGKIIVEAESNGAVRGYVGVPDVELPLKEGKLDVAGALGKEGFLIVTKDLRLKEPYQGMVRLYTGEIAQDLAFYLAESEQIPSAVGLGVYVEPDGGVSAAGGFLIQSFPPYDQAVVDRLIRRIEKMPSVTQMIREGEGPEELLVNLFSGIEYDTLERRPLFFRCSCSKERIEQALISLGREELMNIIEVQETADVRCEFCRETYQFSRRELEQVLEEM